MLGSINLNDKNYEELIEEAISQIPLYSNEWTNFNMSDPGITILQNLTAFQMLQRSYINEITDDIRRRLLAILGYHAKANEGARVALECKEGADLPMHCKLMSGELCFETEEPTTVAPCNIEAVFTEYEGEYKDITYLLKNRDVAIGASIFGPVQKEGMSVVIVFDKLPNTRRPFLLYAQIETSANRNPFNSCQKPDFSQLEWQIYQNGQWVNAEVSDFTFGFLKSGYIYLTVENVSPSYFTEAPVCGLAIRCVLTKANYDLLPRVMSLTANLFEVVQRDTRAASFVFTGESDLKIDSEMTAYGYIYVYCKETEDGPYFLYSQYAGLEETGRFYVYDQQGGVFFDKQRFGFAPCQSLDAVRVCCYDEETIMNRKLGVAYGYENQVIDIHLIEHILSDNFQLLCQYTNDKGEVCYQFVSPDLEGEDDLQYQVWEETGKINIKNAGLLEGAILYICDLATTAGKHGNIRPENRLVHKFPGYPEKACYINPAWATGGTSFETTQELRQRFLADMKTAKTAVTAADYEEIVRRTPGLCIHKVKAAVDPSKEWVQVAVKPYGEEPFPKMSPYYLKQIGNYLNQSRMITTKVQLMQPEYVPIGVKAVVDIKNYYENASQTITDVLHNLLDQIHSDCSFGTTIEYYKIYKAISQIPMVESIYRLQLDAPAYADAKKSGGDIVLGSRSLGYPGKLVVEMNEKRGV